MNFNLSVLVPLDVKKTILRVETYKDGLGVVEEYKNEKESWSRDNAFIARWLVGLQKEVK